MATNASPTETIVLVDRTISPGGRPARESFWDKMLPAGSFQSISIADSVAHLRKGAPADPIRIDSARVVILNWDVANGDYACGSDDVFLYFLTRSDRRDALLRNGGILLCEFQTGKGALHQGAYDAVFGEAELTVQEFTSAHWWQGSEATVYKEYRQHPVVAGIDAIKSGYVDDAGRIFNFAPEDRAIEMKRRMEPDRQLWRGWFRDWKNGWIPLLIAKSENEPESKISSFMPRAVLLAKWQDNGLLLASTMWIAGSRCETLVKNVLNLDLASVRMVHENFARRRKLADIVSFSALLILFLLSIHFIDRLLGFCAVILAARVPARLAEFLRNLSLIDDMGRVWLFIIAWRATITLVFNRPFGIGVLKNLRHRWKISLKENI